VPKATARDTNGAAAPTAEVPAVPAERPRRFEPKYDPERAFARAEAFLEVLKGPRSGRESSSAREARRIAETFAISNMQLLVGICHDALLGRALPRNVWKAADLARWLLEAAGVKRGVDVTVGVSREHDAALAAIDQWGPPTRPEDLEAEAERAETERSALTTGGPDPDDTGDGETDAESDDGCR
jgi:hypothetical protein